MDNNKPFATVKMSKLKKVIAAWEAIKNKNNETDVDVTMDYLIISCFPDLWKKFQDNIHEQYTLGYMAGMKDAEENFREADESEVKGNS